MRIGRVNAYAGDVAGFLQTHVFPGLAPVNAFVDAVTPRYAISELRFAGTDVHDIRVRRRDCHGTNGTDIELAVTDRNPVLAGIL